MDVNELPPLGVSNRWAIRPDLLPKVADALRPNNLTALERLAGCAATAVPQAARRTGSGRAGGAVAVLPLTGVITPRGSLLSVLFGGGPGGLRGFLQEFRQALADPDVGAIVLDVDSPGGVLDLVPEVAEEVRTARGAKPIVAVANTMAASAAYWIAAQADELVVTPSGEVGSIGVYMLHEDWSGWNEQRGIVPTYIYAGRHKVEGNPDEPLTDEARQAWQRDVDDLYEMFAEEVALGRGVSVETVRSDYGEGRTVLAERALAAGMVDRIATLDEVVSDLLGTTTPADRAAAPTTTPTSTATANPVAVSVTVDDADEEQVGDAPPAGAGEAVGRRWPAAQREPDTDTPADEAPSAAHAGGHEVELSVEQRRAIASMLLRRPTK